MPIRDTKLGAFVSLYDMMNDSEVAEILGQTGDRLEDLAITENHELILLGSCGHWCRAPQKYVVEK